MKKINLLIERTGKIESFSAFSTFMMLPYLTEFYRYIGGKGCKVTASIEGPDEVIDEFANLVNSRFGGLISINVEEEPKP